MTLILQCPRKHQCELGESCDSSHYDTLVAEDADCFGPTGVVFKYRKLAFTECDQCEAYAALRPAAVVSNNRGKAAGALDGPNGRRDWVTQAQRDILHGLIHGNAISSEQALHKDETQGQVWLRGKVLEDYPIYENWFERWHEEVSHLPPQEQRQAAEHVRGHYISGTRYSNAVKSGIVGYFDRDRIPYGRPCSYTLEQSEKFDRCIPFLRRLDAIYRQELPDHWRAQRAAADRVDLRFLIAGTVFSTLTVNHNWRTAAHRDDGNLSAGFSCMAAFTGPDGKGWRGAEFILPEYRVAIQLEPRDLLLVASHEAIHANAPLPGDDGENDRLTVVGYFREGMQALGRWEYELLRRKFVNQQGRVRAGMWQSSEWADFLAKHNMVDDDGLVGED